MSEQMARALGAKDPEAIKIAGKDCFLRPLGIRELIEVEKDCLKRYKRSYLQTFVDNLDLLPPDQRLKLVETKMEEVARWDVGNLPHKVAYHPELIFISEEIKQWMKDKLTIVESDEKKLKTMVAAVLDQGVMSEEDYKKMTGIEAPRVSIDYVNWWITGNKEGMITFIWICFSNQDVTREQVEKELSGDLRLLIDLSRSIERMSAPQAGNG